MWDFHNQFAALNVTLLASCREIFDRRFLFKLLGLGLKASFILASLSSEGLRALRARGGRDARGPSKRGPGPSKRGPLARRFRGRLVCNQR